LRFNRSILLLAATFYYQLRPLLPVNNPNFVASNLAIIIIFRAVRTNL
jgi:hypothetical protein